MLLPKSLQKGDTIGIVAPSKPFTPDNQAELDAFITHLEDQDLKVVTSEHFFETANPNIESVAATKRASDINAMFADPEINAIWCFQGGHTANNILDLLDYELIRNNPKLFLGKSDVDVLHLAMNTMTGLITVHTCDTKIGRGKEMDFDYTKEWFIKRLFTKSTNIEPESNWKCVQPGVAQGKILGCNMTSMLKLAGTKYFPNFTDAILFIETLRSYPDRVRLQLTQLRQIGVFEKIRGVVVGNNHDFRVDHLTVEEIVTDFVPDKNMPILKIGEFGHYQPHLFLPIGAKIHLDATNKKLEIIGDFIS